MWKTIVAMVCLTVLRSHCARADGDTPCIINNNYDLESALANAAVCSFLELRANITLTSDNFSPQGITLTDQNVVIQSNSTAKYPTKLDLGTYIPSNAIQVTGNSSVTLRNLQLQNYLVTPVQNGTSTTFMPLFDVATTSSLHIAEVQLLMDAGRCAQDANYSQITYQPRLACLQAPITYERVNLTSSVPVANSANMTLDNCTFSCPPSSGTNTVSYQIVARVWSSLELLGSIKLPDSRLILFQQSLTTANGSWEQAPVLIASSRQVYIIGQANATMSQLISSDTDSASSAKIASQPSFAWTLNDSTDLLQLGYGGSLTLQSLILYLPEPCCVMVYLVGSWYFSNQPLPWNIFGTVLPGAFSVQAVRVPQLNAPAYFTMRNVSIVYATCGADFAAAAQLLLSKSSADLDNSSGNILTYDPGSNTIYCQTCIFQGSQQVPSEYSNAVSTVSLYDTHIMCLPPSSSNASANNVTASGQNPVAREATPLHSNAAGWAPPVWLPVLLAVVCCAISVLGLFAVWRHLRTGIPTGAFTCLQETEYARMSTDGSKPHSPSLVRVHSAVQLATAALRPNSPKQIASDNSSLSRLS